MERAAVRLNRTKPPLQLPTVCVSTESPEGSGAVSDSTATVSALVSPFFTPGPDVLSPTPVRMSSGAAFSRWRSERLSSGSDSAVQMSPPAPFMSHSLTNILALSPLSPPGLSPLHFGDSAFSTPTTSKSTGSRFTFDHVTTFKRAASSAECSSGLDRDESASAFRPPEKTKHAKPDEKSLMDVLNTFREAASKAQQQQPRAHSVLERKQSLMPAGLQPNNHASLRSSESMPVCNSSLFTTKPRVTGQMSSGLSVMIDPPSDEATANAFTIWSSLYAQAAAAQAAVSTAPPTSIGSHVLPSTLSSSSLSSATLTGSLRPSTSLNPKQSQSVLLLSPHSIGSTTTSCDSSKISPSGSAHSVPDDSDLDPDDPRRQQFWCNFCKKDFRRPDILSRHLRRHTGEKPFGCDRCGRFFSRSDHLRTHRRTHTDEKPYACSLCVYAARRRDVLTRHMATRHQAKAGRSIFQKGEVRRCLSDSDKAAHERAYTEVLGPINPKKEEEDEPTDEDDYSDDDEEIIDIV